MDDILNEDIYKIIILMSSISMVKSLSLASKMFYNICNNNNMLLKIFEYKHLEIVNNDVTTINNYIEEYNKISYAKHLCDGLFGSHEFPEAEFHIILKNTYKNLRRNKDINVIKLNIIPKSIHEDDDWIQQLKFFFGFNPKTGNLRIRFWLESSMYRGFECESEISYEKLYMALLKLLYYYPNINILDHNKYPFIIRPKYYDRLMDLYRGYDQNIITERHLYWNEYNKLYENKYH
jgi:hypothetical protein